MAIKGEAAQREPSLGLPIVGRGAKAHQAAVRYATAASAPWSIGSINAGDFEGREMNRAQRTQDYQCPPRLLKQYEAPHLDALHRLRGKVADAMDEFYHAVGEQRAEPILNHYFKDPPPLPERVKRAVAKHAAGHGGH